MADLNSTQAMGNAISNAQYAYTTLGSLLSIIADECIWNLNDRDAALEAQSRLIALTNAARECSKRGAEFLVSARV